MIDPHVHCRDGKQSYKETIAHVFKIAREQGVEKIFDMPNTDPPLLWKQNVLERLRLVPKEHRKNYFLYIGATKDASQLEEAVRCYNTLSSVIGFKLYAGKSTGNLAVLEPEDQLFIYETVAKLGYKGVLAAHCEKESLMKNEFDPRNPVSHARNRPPAAEIQSVKAQIEFAKRAGFKGVLHIAHISTPEAVALVEKARSKIRITCGITPHHLMWDDSKLLGPGGLFYKCNPPLRDKKRVRQMQKLFAEGNIDWLETDHAPHSLEEKFLSPYASGYPSLYLYGYTRDIFLPQIGMNQNQIRRVTRDNILKTFKKIILH